MGGGDDGATAVGAANAGCGGAGEDVFLCGALEGFYSRPWTHEQRLDLFGKMERFGLNAYLYAPKDDHKHRALWRKPYDEDEKAELKALIAACQRSNVHFLYGISPGLDISYSSQDDIIALKHKLDEMRTLGCSAFALLWDDIDTVLPPEDRAHFDTLAHAHVAVTNDVFRHLGRPLFLTCPVEYCANRAYPSLKDSEYLNTLGRGLDKDIGVFWTGAKVVSETITKQEMIDLREVLRRKPVIWDNLHANDYDHQRLFLGPYSGRDPDIIPHIRGVMTNPNCEYSFNVPALFTLSAWSHCFDRDSGRVTRGWNPVSAAELSAPHFLQEIQRPTTVSSARGRSNNTVGAELSEEEKKLMEIDQADIELLFHLFWLPHSHGPKAEMLVNEFKYLRDHAHLVLRCALEPPTSSRTSSSDDEDDDGEMAAESPPSAPHPVLDAPEQEIFDSWMERASSFNNVAKRFSKLCDKFTFVPNRQLFFDLNPYLNNVQVVLSACNRYLKWAGLERCRKPITGGPTLAGLPGGVAGELHRLFPVQSNYEYPVTSVRPSAERNCFQIEPVDRRDFKELPDRCLRLFCDIYGVDASDVPADLSRFLKQYRIQSYLTNGRGRALCVDFDASGDDDSSNVSLAGCVVGTRDAKTAVAALKEAFSEAAKSSASNLPITVPRTPDELPWSLLERQDALISASFISEALFSRTARASLKLMLQLLGDPPSACVVLEKSAPVTRQFLSRECGFDEVAHRGTAFCVLKCRREGEEEEKMED